MAKRERIELVDDLDGSKAVDTFPFSWGGVDYEIELSQKNLDMVQRVMTQLIVHGRKASRTGGRAVRPVYSSNAPSLSQEERDKNKAIREWCQKKGIKIGTTGVISQTIRTLYENEHLLDVAEDAAEREEEQLAAEENRPVVRPTARRLQAVKDNAKKAPAPPALFEAPTPEQQELADARSAAETTPAKRGRKRSAGAPVTVRQVEAVAS